MNYRHSYHAGNFADVFKHVTLLALINALEQKATPFCYLDTHAGSGSYDLTAKAAAKTKEYEQGIYKIFQERNHPRLIEYYLALVAKANSQFSITAKHPISFYPGSPLLAKYALRPQDRLIACELESTEHHALAALFAKDQQASIHHQDGLLALKAFLPPKEKRGLILMDSPFENVNEFSHLTKALKTGLTRFPQGIYALWYPIKERMAVKRFHYLLKNTPAQDILIMELSIYPEMDNFLSGSGIAIINPPWHFKDMMLDIMTWLWKTLTINNQGGISLSFIK